MALARLRRGESGMNYWPGFVDALSTLILSIIFLLTVFVVVQFYLQQEVQGKDTALQRLNTQITQLTQILSMEKLKGADLENRLGALQASLARVQNDRDKLKGQYALDVSEKKNKESQAHITDLGKQLNVALAEHVQELSSYRSDFFGKLREVLGNRPDIRIVGDRFVLQSEIFFDTGRADLKPEGRGELDKVAVAVIGLESQIPPEIAWVLRVDGHTDVRPIAGQFGQFKSNWDLSAARAISVVRYLIDKGVQPNHLLAAGFGEFQPIDTGTTEDAFRRNRRIEFKLTER